MLGSFYYPQPYGRGEYGLKAFKVLRVSNVLSDLNDPKHLIHFQPLRVAASALENFYRRAIISN